MSMLFKYSILHASMRFNLMRGLLCILGFIVSWGVLLYLECLMRGFFWILGFIVLWGITLYLGCWMGGSIGFYFIMGLLCHVGFGCCGYVVSYGFFMWVSRVAPVYTSCVLRGALRFFNEIFLLIKNITFMSIVIRHVMVICSGI
jgi:hypothetical protein